ncbi:MFS transporter [Altericroceibacterium endophyticum]|uniref:MFS transporter n=1 Tax=Altericroceibacterium endophyticum TaxID=1808508 RepID=A0A6I4T9V8_9SPHN|nr:MFS transporter [Altericroceibacterium endophyticum]MXO67149.1 MFS transporter [Altericroceibacterium endophyticum]
MKADPREILAEEPMKGLQIIAVTLCILLNALDGFDVLAISFASPGIAAEWGIDRGALGFVLSMELIGMAFGSIFLGTVADRIGRRPTILGCLVVMAGGMALVPLATSVTMLSVIRLGTGLGIGGMLACTNAMVAELSNRKNQALAVIIMAAGYPFGAIVGGSIASGLLETGGWRDVFVFGAIVTAAFIPLVLFFLPESISFEIGRQAPNSLERVNRTLKRMGHTMVNALPVMEKDDNSGISLAKLFAPGLRGTTLLLTVAYFCHIMTFYFILKWVPKIVVDMGYEPSSAGGVLVWANVGGLLGALFLSALTRKITVRWLVIGALLLSTAMVTYFGQGQTGLQGLSTVAAIAGFCTNAGVVGLYALIAQAFPTKLRAGGTGFVIGLGRGGAALGPIVAGLLFAAGGSLGLVALLMGLGSTIAAIALFWLKPPKETQQAV